MAKCILKFYIVTLWKKVILLINSDKTTIVIILQLIMKKQQMKEQTQNYIITAKITVKPKCVQMALLAEVKIRSLPYVYNIYVYT